MNPLAGSSSGGGGRRLGVAVAAAGLLLGLPAAASASTSSATSSAPLSQEQLNALVKPSIVLITGEYSGHVRFLNANGGHTYSSELHSSYYCTGFVVGNSEGQATIATAGHCADRGEARNALILEFLRQQVKQGFLSAADAKKNIQYAETNDRVLGNQVGTPPIQTIDVYEPSATSGLSTSTRMPATVQADESFDNGDVALLQVHTQQPLPILQISSSEPTSGAALTAVGYPSAVSNVTDASLAPSFETGHMNSLQTRNGLPVIQFDAGLSPGMSGGPVVNAQGQVIGINSYLNSAESQQFNFAVDLSTIHSFFSSHGVSNTLSPADVAYRKGLTDYFHGLYREAIPQFNVTLNTIPADAVAQQYKSQAVTKAPTEPKHKSGGVPIWLIVLAVGLVVIVGAVAAVLLQRRRPGAGANAGYAIPVQPGPPAMETHACPTCGNVFPASQPFCPNDGSALAPPPSKSVSS